MAAPTGAPRGLVLAMATTGLAGRRTRRRDRRRRTPTDDPEQDRIAGLVTLAQQGDAEAFGMVYDAYVDQIFRYLYYRVGSHAAGRGPHLRDVPARAAPDRLVHLHGKDIGAWFTTIARNLVTDHVKSSRFKLEVTTADMLDADRADDGIEQEVLDKLQNAALLDAVASSSRSSRSASSCGSCRGSRSPRRPR